MQADERREWANNRVGPYRVLRRLRGTTAGEDVGRVYTAVQVASGRPALLVVPVTPSHWSPDAEWRLRIRTFTAPGPFLAVEVEQAPQRMAPVTEMADGMEALMLALEGVERHPDAVAHVSSPLPPERRARRLEARAPFWTALAAVALLALVCLPRVWPTAQPAQQPGEAMGTGAAEQALEAPEALPVGTLAARTPWGAVGLDMPKRAFKGQRLAPCADFEVEVPLREGDRVERSCWIAVKFTPAQCRRNGYEWKGSCYLPSYPPQREPSSIVPPRTHPVPAQQRQ